MAWIKLNHVGGLIYVNSDQIYNFEKNGVAGISIYGSSSNVPVTYFFSSSDEVDEIIAKLEKILKVIDINQLAIQTEQ